MTFHNSVLIQDDNFHTVKGGGDIELHDKDCDDKEDNSRPPPPLRRPSSHCAVDVCDVIFYKDNHIHCRG